jgi:hypothetical protein
MMQLEQQQLADCWKMLLLLLLRRRRRMVLCSTSQPWRRSGWCWPEDGLVLVRS